MTDGLRLDGLVVQVGDRPLVEDASLALDGGRIVALVGGSGCGKTLTARALLGMVEVTPGVVSATLEVRMQGRVWRPYEDMQRGVSRQAAFAALRGDVIGYLPQDARAALDPLQRVGAQVANAARLAGNTDDPRRWLERVGLEDVDRVARLYAHALSGGMAQRVVIAQTLARGSRILLADEPTTGLDATVQVSLLAQFRDLADQGVAVLLITHDLRLLPDLADEVVLMDAGRTVEALPARAWMDGRATTAVGRDLVAATRRIAAGRLG